MLLQAEERKVRVLAYSTAKHRLFMLSCRLAGGLLRLTELWIWFVEATCLSTPLEEFGNVFSMELEKSVVGELDHG